MKKKLSRAKKKLTYASVGVSYQSLDAMKIQAQQAALATASHLDKFGPGYREVEASRGESAFVWQEGQDFRAMVIEGLGTKNRVADAMRQHTGKTYYDGIAQDTVAAIINDLIVVGAQPQVISAYFAVGDSNWFTDQKRNHDLVTGWQRACDLANVTWGGGETPTLTSIVEPNTIDLAGSAVGLIRHPNAPLLGDELVAGDIILLIESSGIHANGLTLARAIADRLAAGYKSVLPDGQLYGEALLIPTHLYAQLLNLLHDKKVELHYAVNITGHGWRKLMRARQSFSYVIQTLPPVPSIFTFIQNQVKSSHEDMYATFNMGAGFALYLPELEVTRVQELAKQLGFQCWRAGRVLAGDKKVIIEPLKLTFTENSLQLR